MRSAPCAVVVDSAPSTRQRVAVVLQLAGWRVYGVAGMPEALRATAALDPDLVITEARVRGGSGLALADHLRRNGHRARCLLLTARPTARLRAQATALGAGCLAKPLDPGGLAGFLAGRRPTVPPAAPPRPLRVTSERVWPAAQATTTEHDDGPGWAQRERSLYLKALPHHLSWIAESARAGDADTVADEAERGIVSQPELMQLVLLASAQATRR